MTAKQAPHSPKRQPFPKTPRFRRRGSSIVRRGPTPVAVREISGRLRFRRCTRSSGRSMESGCCEKMRLLFSPTPAAQLGGHNAPLRFGARHSRLLCNRKQSGRGSAWLERLVRDQEVGGSNPLAPTILFNEIFAPPGFSGRPSRSGCSTCTIRGNNSYQYDSLGNLLSATDPLGYTTSYTYDANDNVASETQPPVSGGTPTTTYTYNSFGEVLTMTGRGPAGGGRWGCEFLPVRLEHLTELYRPHWRLGSRCQRQRLSKKWASWREQVRQVQRAEAFSLRDYTLRPVLSRAGVPSLVDQGLAKRLRVVRTKATGPLVHSLAAD